MNNNFKNTITYFFSSIEKKRRKNLIILVLILTISSILEFLTLATIVPLLSSILNVGFSEIKLILIMKNFFSVNDNFNTFLTLFIIFIILSVSFRILAIKQNEKFAALLSSDLSSKIFYNTISQDYSSVISQSSNNLIAGMTEKITMYSGLVKQLLNLLSSIIISTGIIVYLFSYNVYITLITLVFIILIFTLIALLSKYYLNKNGILASKYSEKRFKIIQESISGIRDIIINNSEKLFLNAYRKVESKFRLSIHRLSFGQNSPKLLIEGLGIITLLSTSYFLFQTSASNEKQFLVNLAVFAFAAQKLLPLVNSFYTSWAAFKSYIPIVYDVHQLLNRDNKREIIDDSKIKQLSFNDKIKFKDLTFIYEGTTEKIIEKFTTEIQFNTIIGLIGKTGSGKSTFVDLLIGLLKPSDGQILIDDVVLDKYSLNSWHKKISHVPQNAFLLNDTVRRNIIFQEFGNYVDEDKLTKVCIESNVHEFIKNLPDGLDTVVGERGLNLSGGQRQRITIARALYSNKPILVLDEATNALDYQTEELILNNIKNNYKNKTIIMISHRIENLKFVNKIIDLNK